MAFKTDMPPHQSAQPIDAPPTDADRPNMAMLKADIDSGKTGDKTEVFDPGMAMIGTCEEAAGTPLKPEQVALARDYETKQRWRLGSRKTGAAHNKGNLALYGFAGFIVAAGAAIVGAIWMLG